MQFLLLANRGNMHAAYKDTLVTNCYDRHKSPLILAAQAFHRQVFVLTEFHQVHRNF